MLRPFAGEVHLLPLDSRKPVDTDVDIALFDPFSPANPEGVDLGDLVAHPRLGKVVVYSWQPDRARVQDAIRTGATAFVSKTSSAHELVAALKRVHAGELVPPPVLEGAEVDGVEEGTSSDRGWPGREAGLTAREAEVIGYITQGMSIRTSYRKMGVTSRTNAVLWGLDHGFGPDRGRGSGLN
jgi:DNA-binding NarL/FixJ family response regulator